VKKDNNPQKTPMLPFRPKVFVRAKDSEKVAEEKRVNEIKARESGQAAKLFYDEVMQNEPSERESRTRERRERMRLMMVASNFESEGPRVVLTARDLFRAVEAGDEEAVAAALDAGVNVDARDEYGWTPLMSAACAGHEFILKLLIDRGANVNALERGRRKAVDLARAKNHLSLVAFLEEAMVAQSQGGTCEKTEAVKDVDVPETLNSAGEFFCDICQSTTSMSSSVDHASSLVHKFHECKANPSVVPTLYGLPESNRGFRMMVDGGWNRDRGLGPSGREGAKFPVRTILKRDRAGLGSSEAPARKRVTHFGPGDESSVAEPSRRRKERQATLDGRERDRRRRRGAAAERSLRAELNGL
jgi:hypothetical protein